ncbi:TolC family protein [Microbulbifer rhizosphaerae]|uniref:Cobalt-zinc-cadmium efflux system outer membrane protein n=1 Tax=Microbulbifer rhizosphaerae TaxID=1562603 RepID=A0A7W4ZB53_9GAMM|nr:cobalt-zinc-cadmium efflux system outer membrane protein [Microbulbifer rhizosphaerae]
MAHRRKGTRAPHLFLAVALGVAACTPLPADLGRSQVIDQVRARGRPAEAVDPELVPTLVSELSAAPLTADRAMQIALINNPEIRAHYAKLGIAAADVYRAGRIRNPVFSAAVLDSNRAGDVSQNTYSLVVSLSDLITLPARRRLAEAEFAIVQREIGAELLQLAAKAEEAFYHFVTAKQVAAMRGQVARAADLSRQLAERYFQAGNLTQRQLALENAAAAEAQINSLEAENAAFAARTKLAAILGLSVAGDWDAPAQLALPVAREDELRQLLLLARENRLDLAAAIARTDRLADKLCYNNWRRWLGELDIGVEYERETDGARLLGPTLEWEIPIFNQRGDRLLEVDAELQKAISEVARLMLNTDNGVRLAYVGTQNARARVEVYRTRLVPARMEAVAQAQLEENFMLIGTFELLLSKQREYDAFQGYLQALGDYWVARAALAEAVGRRLPSSDSIALGAVDPHEYLHPAAGGMRGMDSAMPGARKEAGKLPPHHAEDAQEAPEDAHRHH